MNNQTQAQQLGIVGIKIVLKPVIKMIGHTVDLVKGDRSWIQVIPAIGGDLFAGRDAVSYLNQAWQEVKDLNVQESFSIKEFFEVEFDIEDDVLESTIEEFVAQAPTIYSGVNATRDIVVDLPSIITGPGYIEVKVGAVLEELNGLFKQTVIPISATVRLLIEKIAPKKEEVAQ